LKEANAMLEEHALELINAEIDGELGPEERAELDALLEASEPARALRAELRKLANLLDGLPEEVPPADLAGRILEDINLPERRPAFSLSRLFASVQPATAGFAFAAGLLLAVGFYELSPGDRFAVDTSNMVGTMVMNPKSDVARQTDTMTVQAPGISGTVSISVSGEFKILSFDLASAEQTEIQIALAETGLGFGGIAHGPVVNTAGVDYYEVSGGSLRVVNEESHPFTVYLRRIDDAGPRPEGIGIRVIQSGESVFAGSLGIHGEGG